jgi:polysaccharide export outer membrane protein
MKANRKDSGDRRHKTIVCPTTVGTVVVLGIAACIMAAAQTSTVLMNGSGVQNGIGFSYETRLEPPVPAFAGGFVGGAVTDDKGIHRYMAYNQLHQFFGYDLKVERDTQEGGYRVIVGPLSIDPARIELENPASWTVVAIPAQPSAKTLHAGESMAFDLFTNAATGQKIVEYLHFKKPAGYQVAINDVLHINVLHQPDIGGQVTVRPDGFIVLNPIGEVKAAGLTLRDLSDAITSRLTKYFNHPEVNVQVLRMNYRNKYNVSGNVRKPGSYALTSPKTVMEAITEAGGPIEFAKTKAIFILRGREKLPFNYMDVSKGKNLEQNITLQPGDIIQVP